MADDVMFIMDPFEDPETAKQTRYDEKVTRLIMGSVGIPSLQISRLLKIWKTSGRPLLSCFIEEYSCPVSFDSRRFRHPVLLAGLFNRPSKTELWKAYQDARSNYPDAKHFGLILSCHGDQVDGELILHNAVFLDTEKKILVRLYDNDQILHLEKLDSFLVELGKHSHPTV